MAFPTIPTAAASRIIPSANTSPAGTHTFPDLNTLTKNSGDLLIAIVIIYDGNSTNAEFSGWGGGFTEFVDQATASTMGIGAAYKWSTGSETGTFTVTSAETGTNDSQCILLSIAGAHDSTPPVGGTITNGTSAAANIAALNPAGWDVEDTLWIAVCGAGEVSGTGSFLAPSAAPANYTDLFVTAVSADVVGGVYGAVAFRQLAAASDDPDTFTVDTSNARNSALLIAVRPAPAPTPVGNSDLVTSWIVTAQVTSDLATSWRVYEPVAASDLVTSWKVLTGGGTSPVGPTDLVTSWRVFTPVAASDLATSWKVAARVTSDLATSWRVSTPVGASDLATSWRVLAPVGASDLATSWRVLSSLISVTSDLVTSWRVAARITSDLATGWRVFTPVASDLATSWRVYAPVAATDLVTSWRVLQSVLPVGPSDLATSWKVSTLVGSSDLVTSWKVLVAPITLRPSTGTTARPNTGTTARPFAGVTSRP